jgi:hypothetical protein
MANAILKAFVCFKKCTVKELELDYWYSVKLKHASAVLAVLLLGGVANNPVKQLYQQFGFVDLKHDVLSSCSSLMTLFCIFGFPHCRIVSSIIEKNLVETAEPILVLVTHESLQVLGV